MIETAVIYVVLAAAALLLYGYTRRQGNGGASSGFLQWLRQGTKRVAPRVKGGVLSDASARIRGGTDVNPQEVTAVLSDIYREFVEESRRLEDEFRAALDETGKSLEQRLKETEEKLAALQSILTALEVGPVSPLPVATGRSHVKEHSAEQPEEKVDSAVQDVDAASRIEKAAPETSSANLTSPDMHPADGIFDERYFQILDQLVSGRSAKEIAAQLKVNLADVERVKHLMAFGQSHFQ